MSTTNGNGHGATITDDLLKAIIRGLPGRDPLATAIVLEGSFWPVAVRAPGEVIKSSKGERIATGKEMCRRAWGLNRWSSKDLNWDYSCHPGRGVAICLGPGRGPRGEWLGDVEGDGPEAEHSFLVLFGGELVETLGWDSARGRHLLMFFDAERLISILARLKRFESQDASTPGVYHFAAFPGVELRLGGYKANGDIKQLASVCPPTKGSGGEPRRWNGALEVAWAPDVFYENLARLADYAEDLNVTSNTARPNADGSFSWTATAGDAMSKYGAVALADECRIVAETTAGGRNIQLNLSAFKVARLVASGAIARDQAEAGLVAAGRQAGLDEAEIADTIASGFGAGSGYPRDLSHVGAKKATKKETRVERALAKSAAASVSADGDAGATGTGDEPSAELPPGEGHEDPISLGISAMLHCTDLGNAERLVYHHGRDFRYCHPWKKFVVWDGQRWAVDNTGAVRRWAKATVRRIYREAGTLDGEDKDARGELAEHAVASEDRKRIAAMLHLAEAEKNVPILPEELNTDPWSFNVLNGTIDLRTGLLEPHRRKDFITTLCRLNYVSDAQCPLWLQTLEFFFAGDQELIAYWQRICGLALAGVIRDHILPIAYGSGSNGKSTILGTLLDVFGPDYAMKAMPDMLMAKKNDSHPTDKADLFGKRLVVAIETEEGRRLNETLTKELTGGDRIRARRMREDPWEFPPTHTLIMATNHKPRARGTDNGLWRRLKLVPFTVTVADDKADKEMPEKLKGEYEGILAWCVQGCLDWQNKGLKAPECVEEATAGYRREQDLLARFIEDECLTGNVNFKAKAGLLYARYKDWATKGNEYVMTQTMFGLAMVDRGYEKKESHGMWYHGIGLRQTDEAE